MRNAVNLSLSERILVVLGWSGLIIILSTIGALALTIVASVFFDYQFGMSLLLLAVIVIAGAIFLSYYFYHVSRFEKDLLRFFPPKVVICPYCNMKNSIDSTFCIKCGKALPESRLRKLERTETNID